MNWEGMLDPIIERAKKANEAEEGDYEADGFLHCGSCHTTKQRVLMLSGRKLVVPCLCKCKEEALIKEETEIKQRQHGQFIASLCTSSLQDMALSSFRFEHSEDEKTKQIEYAKRYVRAFDRMKEENIGLLFWGKTGSGKTFTAGCIANALLDQGVPVLMTSFPRLLLALSSLKMEDRNGYMDAMRHYDLLILDDLGAERDSSFAREMVYAVIDSRYKTKKPLIVTTNLSLGGIQKAEDVDYQRIYDRVLALCTPIGFHRESRRKETASRNLETVKELFG